LLINNGPSRQEIFGCPAKMNWMKNVQSNWLKHKYYWGFLVVITQKCKWIILIFLHFI